MLDKILCEMGIPSYVSCEEVHGGKDSKVFRVEVQKGKTYALRLLPSHKHEQFIREKSMIQLASGHGIRVPEVHSVILFEGFSAMLMEWVSGKPIFIELLERPQNAKKIGFEFGLVQATINRISLPMSTYNKSWLSPSNGEEEIFNKISHTSQNHNLLHLDYHPLNVLTDGEKITGVIDWANATAGDYRFDIARTLSILKIEGYKHFKDHLEVIDDFEAGWLEGYEQVAGRLEAAPLFNAWAGFRMKRDLAETLNEQDLLRIQELVEMFI